MRREEYRDAWRDMTPEELSAGLRLKAARIDVMLRNGGSLETIQDDLIDLLNYGAFLYETLKSQNDKHSST